MEQLPVHTAIHGRYQVLDISGQLPFSVIFGLCRRSSADRDTRPIVLRTANSALDVPYAIAHRLLTLHEERRGGVPETQVHISSNPESLTREDGEYLTLSSPVNRTEHWREAMTIYQYRIDPNSELASMLQPGRKYTIRLASEDLGVKWWAYSDGDQYQRPTTQASEPAKLVNSKPSAGKASFTAVPALPWPPKVETHLRLCRAGGRNAPASSTLLVSLRNTGPQPITIQTRGPQRFLVPWGPFQPEAAPDSRAGPALDSSLCIVDALTQKVIRGPGNPGLANGRRPGLGAWVTLVPGEPLERRVDVGGLLAGLPDGKYGVRMERRGVRWCGGEIAGGDGRVSRRLCKMLVPPLVLETDEVVELRIQGGRVVG
ncbi:hypothetical protein F4810DRAFT_138839 [Camillea tinctor]|nr:hypothetical protein F4810DRAFT_138839 [Camillea tinctor]